MTILDRIVADRQAGLVQRKRELPLAALREMALRQPPPRDFPSALRGDGIRVIAEVKKASPSRGIIRADFDPVNIARTYAANGAAAISVLTEEKYFQGSLDYLTAIRGALGESSPPLLRKDFIDEPYQVYESRAYGADAMLLIAASLTREQFGELIELSHSLGMACLIEVHNEAELENVLGSPARVIGINNRDLNTFKVDIATTGRLRPLIPADKIVVSESGISSRAALDTLRRWRVDAALIGGAFMASSDTAAKMRELL